MHPFEYTRLVFLGMVGSMMLYNSLKFIQLRDVTYFFYTAYMFCMIVYFSRALFLDVHNSNMQYQLGLWLSVIAPMLSYIFYYRFTITFLELKKTIPFLYKLSRALILAISLFILIYTFVKFVSGNQAASMILHDLMRLALIIASIIGISATYKQRKPIMNYFATGSLFLTLGGTIAFIMSMNYIGGDTDISLFETPLFYFEIGIILEIFCFSLGLAYKQRVIEMEKGRAEEALLLQTKTSEIARIKAVLDARELERNRISKELHDDLGSGLTQISLLSEMIKRKSINEIAMEIEKISKSSGQLIDNLSEIVWTMNPRHDLLESLIVYLRTYSIEYFENANIDFNVKIPNQIPESYLTSEVRRNIFLVVKESFHNIIKHSESNKVDLTIEVATIISVQQSPMKRSEKPFYRQQNTSHLHITISDNGQGIDFENQTLFSNGLRNMKDRMKNIGGSFEITNDNGVKTQIRYPLNSTKN